MDNNILWHKKTTLSRVAENIRKNKFKCIVVDDRESARKQIMEIITEQESVGLGGSKTLDDIEIKGELGKRNQLVTHQPDMPPEKKIEIRRKALTADAYMASPNAVTYDGKLMFWDGIGNRVCGMIFGPKKVIAVAGVNKIVKNEEVGWQRMKDYANPTNVKRLKMKTPCAETGVCSDCNSEDRICNVRIILDKKPKHTDYYVILIPEELGF